MKTCRRKAALYGEEGLVTRFNDKRDNPIIGAITEAEAESDLCGTISIPFLEGLSVEARQPQ